MKNFLSLISIEWKEARRSPLWHKNLLINLVLGISFLYMMGMFVALGVFLDDILIKIPMEGIDYNAFKESFVLRKLNRFLLYYFFVDLIVRYFMQKLPALSVQPFLHLPLRKSQLIHYMLGKSFMSPMNLIHWLVFVPFMIELFSNLSFSESIGWSAGFAFMVYLNNYLLTYLKRTSDVDYRVYLSMLFALVAIIALDWYDLVDFQAVSETIFNSFFLLSNYCSFTISCWSRFLLSKFQIPARQSLYESVE